MDGTSGGRLLIEMYYWQHSWLATGQTRCYTQSRPCIQVNCMRLFCKYKIPCHLMIARGCNRRCIPFSIWPEIIILYLQPLGVCLCVIIEQKACLVSKSFSPLQLEILLLLPKRADRLSIALRQSHFVESRCCPSSQRPVTRVHTATSHLPAHGELQALQQKLKRFT